MHAAEVSARRVILLPGIVTPATVAFGDLMAELGPDAEVMAKELEVYASAAPPEGYPLDVEVAGVLAAADERGWDRFHLVGFSGGGSVALALAAGHAERLWSLALLEPAWAGNWDDASVEHRALWPEYARLASLPAEQSLPAFVRIQLRPGVAPPPPPPAPPPAWMAIRPAGIRVMVDAFLDHDLDREALGRFDRPVYIALGALSNPHQFGEEAERLSRVFGDYWVQVFPDRHHFDPPHRAEAPALAGSLLSLWDRGETAVRPRGGG
jgi:pimeloyl-ACP methyl ester carboxylesterase